MVWYFNPTIMLLNKNPYTNLGLGPDTPFLCGMEPAKFVFVISDSWQVLALHKINVFCLFDLIIYVPSTIFQLNRDGSSWFEPVLS